MIGLSGIIVNLSAAALVSLSPGYPSSYKIEVKLDTGTNKLSGVENIEFMNPTSDSLDQICFHLYPNAFKDTSSAFCREDSRIRSNVASGNNSRLDVSELTINSQPIDSGAIKETGTLLYVKLPKRLPPLQIIVISLKFELKIPKTLMRLGYNDLGNYLLSHWHPILGGYQKGRLVDFEYHANGEFFSNFSSYDVKLDIPSGFQIGSTGELTEISKDSSRAIWQAHADSVIDFAFACGPAFKIRESDTLGIHIRYMLEDSHIKYASNADAITKFSLSYNSQMFFKYPYKTFTLVDFEPGASGMELPGMVVITFPRTRMFSNDKRILELTIAHEITHEWFYATVASDEAYEPWLDEGITSYVTDRLLEAGGDTLGRLDIFGYKFRYNLAERISALIAKGEYPINLRNWDYPDEISYATGVYHRSTLVLKTLAKILGQAQMDGALGEYARKFRFGYPDSSDFMESIAKYTGKNLDTFYAQYVGGTARVDYSVRSLGYKTITVGDSLKKYQVTVSLARELDGILPQKVSVMLGNGAKFDTTWDGIARITTIEFQSVSKPRSASIENDGAYALDENSANNTYYIDSFGSRLISFEWDAVFFYELLLAIIL